jgi:nucleotide-binding universal stress UspA family protein
MDSNKSFTYFVPVDFSPCSYNALHYATMLARCSYGQIMLSHVIDLEEVPDSENAVVISFAIDRLVKKAEERIKSLREIISLKGIVVKQEILIGNVELQLLKQIDELKPDVIVMGRNTEHRLGSQSLLKNITKNTNVPVLVVPVSHNPKIPNRAVLASDMDPKKKIKFAPFFEIIKKVSHELSILDIKSGYFSNAQEALTWIKNLNETYGVEAKLLQQEDKNGLANIKNYVQTNEVDLICTVRYNSSILDKLFGRSISNQLTNQLEVPVLVIKE